MLNVNKVGQHIQVAIEFRDAEGGTVPGPANTGSNYVWTFGKTGGEAVATIDTSGNHPLIKPVKAGTDTLTLQVTLDDESVLTGTLEFTVVEQTTEDEGGGATQAKPVTVVLTGSVVSSDD